MDPLTDGRWEAFVDRQPMASVFHTKAWLGALRHTYGYEPVVYTTAPPTAKLTNGVLLCRVTSWLTGRRMVGLPFADHCEPLVERPEDLERIFRNLQHSVKSGTWRYVEVRPRSSDPFATLSLRPAESFWFHTLDLRASPDDLFQALHKDSIRRKLRRAEREHLHYEQGRSDALLASFYQLQLLTRRRHGLPPQPLEWFENLMSCFGDRFVIHVVSKRGRPVGAIVTLRYVDTLVYKYGASDAAFHNLGGMPLLFWNAMLEAKQSGIRDFDLGRSAPEAAGLIAFKDHFGATRSMSTYLRYSNSNSRSKNHELLWNLTQFVSAHLPDRLLIATGRWVYRHVG